MRSDLSLAVVVQLDGVFLQLRHQVIGGHEPAEKVTEGHGSSIMFSVVVFLVIYTGGN